MAGVNPSGALGDGHEPRTPPSSTEAEQALLGAILRENLAYGRVKDFLQPEHFSYAVHQRIYAAIGKLIARGQTANPVTLKDLFLRDEALVQIGGASYLAQLADSAITILNAEDYGRQIHDLYLRRQLISLSQDVIDDAYEHDLDDDAQAQFARVEERFRELSKSSVGVFKHTTADIIRLLSLEHWLEREITPPIFLLGHVVTNTSRVEIIGPTGLGKTNLGLAIATAIAAGSSLLHWEGSGSPQRVLYIDGEMSRRLMQARLKSAADRACEKPKTLYVLSREDFPDLRPLNDSAGQSFVDRIIDQLGGLDLIVFDNVQCLLVGDMKDEEPWQQTLPWIRDLTRRGVGQIWFHHTGHDQSRGYGTKTREWELDTVILLEAVERPDADLSFGLKFTKARERSPNNRADFERSIITLTNGEWRSEPSGPIAQKGARGGKPVACDRMFELLREALARHGAGRPGDEYIPPGTLVVSEDLWRLFCREGCISEGGENAQQTAFRRGAKKLVENGKVKKWGSWVWIPRP